MSEAKIQFYKGPAGGWGALRSVARQLLQHRIAAKGSRTLLSANQPDGFDCPGCAWPDRQHTSSFEFCENGVKAVAAEATADRATPEVIGRHTVTELHGWSDHALEAMGRLTEPMAYDLVTDRYRAIGWDEAFATIARHLRALPSPDEAIFYTSGRTSNEAAFLYQLFVRAFDRGHSLRLIKAGVDYQIRETFESALVFGKNVLISLGVDEVEAAEITRDVRRRDTERLELQVAGGIAEGRWLMRGNMQTPTPEPFSVPRKEGEAGNKEAADAMKKSSKALAE